MLDFPILFFLFILSKFEIFFQNFIHADKMEEHKHHSLDGLAAPRAFSTKPTHPP